MRAVSGFLLYKEQMCCEWADHPTRRSFGAAKMTHPYFPIMTQAGGS